MSDAVVQFTATWCAPCHQIKPVLAVLAEKKPDVLFTEVDINEHPDLQEQYAVTGVPTILRMRDGEVLARVVGAKPIPVLRSTLQI